MKAYVADTRGGDQHGSVQVVDLASGEVVHSLDTHYHPDVAVSPDGSTLYVVQTDLGEEPARHRLLAYDAVDYSVTDGVEVRHRLLYNVAPTSNSLVVSDDGRQVYVLETETLGDDLARHSIGVYQRGGSSYQSQELTLPHSVTNFGTLANRPALHFSLAGKRGEAVGSGEPTHHKLPRQLSTSSDRHDDVPFQVAASAADPSGELVYLVTRNGELRVLDVDNNIYSEPVRLGIPEGQAVPLQHLLVVGSTLYLGLARSELAAQGKSEWIWELEIRGGVFRKRSICLWPPSEKIAVTRDGAAILGLSREARCLTVINTESGLKRGRVANVGETPVALAVAA